MKRFLMATLCLLLLAVGGYYAVYEGGFYIARNVGEEPSVPFLTEGSEWKKLDGDHYEPLVFRGVEISSSMPGQYVTAYATEEEDYLRWFTAIGDMGANAVRASNIMDDDFYNALYIYNTSHENSLYLLQGISVSDAAGNGSGDAYEQEFFAALAKNGRDLVDVIHGRKNLAASNLQGSGMYRRDVSSWVAGILIGSEWYPDTVAYTDHRVIYSSSYAGTYFQTTEEATVFEAMLAQVMDEVAGYETAKYGVQRPLGLVSDPSCDFLEYEEVYARQLGKYAWIDPEHVEPTEAMSAGRFAAYRLYDFCPDFTQYLAAEQKAELASILNGVDTAQIYDGYLDLLSSYHTMPVLAVSYGFSSARGATKMGESPLTEQQQGEKLVQISQTLEADGWAGGFISSWQDVWERRTWNTAFATVPTKNYLWHDLQTEGQNYGLMAFDPGESAVCTVDGDPSEWEEADRVLTWNDMTVFARYDAEGLYLLVEGVSPTEKIYLPLDLGEHMGSYTSADHSLDFARASEFLLCLEGEQESRLLVQERYDSVRENFLHEMEGRDPFANYPEKDSPMFIPIRMALDNDTLVDMVTPETRSLLYLGTWETGRLVHGNGDPESPDYNSRADFCYGEGSVEVRLPWLLLNVGDPSSMMVHKDYYEHYGVEFQRISEMWIGAARAGEMGEIPMEPFSLKGWKSPVKYRERLKQSYTEIQQYWRGGEKRAADS